jgi:tRNA A37 threonylcarbamoyladenosine dehydratase
MEYKDLFQRNLGLISEEQQSLLKDSNILICGVGGMGGVAAEVLVRAGVGALTIIDPDVFDVVNINRQIHCNVKSIGKPKVSVLRNEFLKINPHIKIKAIQKEVSIDNILPLLSNITIIINGMDQFLPSIILERTARLQNISVIDAWITPFASVFLIRPTDPHWEQYLDLCTKNKSIQDISNEDISNNLKKEVEYTFSHFKPLNYIQPGIVNNVLEKKIPRPSFCPVVWLSGTLMANEAIKYICGFPTTDYKGVFFDQYNNNVMVGKI